MKIKFMNHPSTKSRVMHYAHALLKFYPTMEWGEIIKLAWQFIYLRRMLQQGIVKFSYLKTDKTLGVLVVRPARGTLNMELIPIDKRPVESLDTRSAMRTPSWGTMAYFDLDKMEWRSFKLPYLNSIESYSTLNTINLNEEEE